MDTKSQGDLARSPSSRHDGAASHPSNNPNQGPRAYSGLTEVDAPRPVQNTSDDSLYRTHVTLEDRAGGPETWRSRRSWDGGRHLHDRQDQRLERLSRRNSLERVLSWRRRSAEGREGNSDANPARTRRHDVGSPAQEEEEEGEEQEEYSVPDNWYNLDEITAPVPVENPDESPLYRHHSLEQQLSRASHRREAVQEPRPPSPVRPSAREDVDLEQAPPREKLKRRRRRQRRVISRLVTEAYTISYLVFFSILGTLARIGLEALTSYPGAPVAYTTVWVNLAGTLVLGFLSESSERFNGRIAKDSDEPERNSLKPEDPTSSDDSTRNEGHNSPSQPFQTEGDAQRTHDVSFGTGAAAGGEGGGVAVALRSASRARRTTTTKTTRRTARSRLGHADRPPCTSAWRRASAGPSPPSRRLRATSFWRSPTRRAAAGVLPSTPRLAVPVETSWPCWPSPSPPCASPSRL
ncbi:hypothetical protein VTK73DRAFT_1038 [Phialemonium thermophilum]|uniref:SMODS and SLOG-associating 2TM effector domain-containing protein n=1 Tax=Phialemonium thermophilum TaxID=223376 RepID=A0ABR3VTZ9_9PEZI